MRHATIGALRLDIKLWLLAAAVVAALTSAVIAVDAAAQVRGGDPAKWRALWTQMMPVYKHDRCINCHNKVNPRLEDPDNNHGGGQLETQAQFACIGCHTKNTTVVEGRCELDQFSGKGKVSLADGKTLDGVPCSPEDEKGKIRMAVGPTWGDRGPDFPEDMRELCEAVKVRKPTPEQFVDHVQNDFLIDWAFKGNRGMDEQSQYWPPDREKKDLPPLTKPEFVNLVTRWITEAAMACGADGTLSLDDNVKLDSKTPFAKGKVRNETTAKVKIADDVATSELHYDEASEALIKTVLPGCPAREGAEVHFKADGEPDTRYEINILPNDTYRMRFTLGTIEGETVWSYKEQLCRPGTRGREKLPTEKTIPLRFGVEQQKYVENAEHELILEGSTTVPDNLGVAPFVSSGDRKLSWHIVIH